VARAKFGRQATSTFMPLEYYIWGLAGIIVLAAAFSCATYLYWSSLQRGRPSTYIVTILIIVVTALISGFQFVFPEILSGLRRNREALMAGEWWRMVTPLFVQAAGWKQCFFNGVGALVFCPLAERLYGKRLLALYFVSGVLGEVFAYKWSPYGAGSSLGIAGVMGGLFAFTLLHRQKIPKFVSIFGIYGLIGAGVLCVCQDNHGPPVVIGALLASLMTILWPDTALKPTPIAP